MVNLLIFLESERECQGNEDLLCTKFKKLFPKIYIGCPRRFYETVMCIVAPTRPSLRGKSRLSGLQLSSYWKRTWEPRIRNLSAIGEDY